MVPNQSVDDHVGNPARDSAIHFGAFLQLRGRLRSVDGNSNLGYITVDEMRDEFTNHYQPQYHTYLVLTELLATLQKYQVIRKRNKTDKQNRVVRVILHPYPAQVREPESFRRTRVYVDQTRVFREKIHRPEVVNETKCRLCNVSFFNEDSKTAHLNSDGHKFRLLYREKRSSFKSVVGASISIADRSIEDSEVILRSGEQCKIKVKVTLDTSYSEADIYKIFEKMDLGEIDVTPTRFLNDVPIEADVSAMFPDPGAYLYPLVVKIASTKNLCLLKDLIFRVESELMDQLAPEAPYNHRKENIIREMEGPLLPGIPLEKQESHMLIKVPLGDYKIPLIYNKLLIHKLQRYENITEFEEQQLNKVLSLLCGLVSYRDALNRVSETKVPFIRPLEKENYSERFALLVHLEELQEQRQVKNYDRTDQMLKKCSSKFMLEVPDLSEGRPSVSRGDKVHVRLQQQKNDTIYEAVIHEVQKEGLLLGMHWEFSEEYQKLKNIGIQPLVDIRFTVNRFPYLNMHRALSLLHKHGAQSIVLPERRGSYFPPTRTPALRAWVNPLVQSNPEQQLAVEKIISKSSGSAPYLVFGPPGTGKTVTLVEAISQVWYADQAHTVHQLVCAPSNAACNNIAEKLITVLPSSAKIYRLYSLSSDDMTVPESLLPYSNCTPSQGMMMPSMDDILTNHIIVVTIVTAGRIVSGGGGGQFQYVYVDECGQASEPEAVIAIAGILTSSKCQSLGQLVLAGDPKQLGPVLSSQLAKDFGLGMSLLERLMNYNSLYRKSEGSGYDNNYLTKLVQNFRSHENILYIPNNLFYDNELMVKGNPNIINKAVGWQELPNRDFPLIFHGVQGLDERESNSPSYFNRQEIDLVLSYIQKLFKKGLPKNYKVEQEDIGVITPYRKQVQKFRKAFGLKGWDIKVGSVEEFQGDEKLIIFISTVRSSVELVEEDYHFRLGFLKNPKRFNVSVTRAKALLVVVGNPNILRHDRQWYQLLRYCHNNKAYRGIPYPDEDPLEYPQEHISS